MTLPRAVKQMAPGSMGGLAFVATPLGRATTPVPAPTPPAPFTESTYIADTSATSIAPIGLTSGQPGEPEAAFLLVYGDNFATETDGESWHLGLSSLVDPGGPPYRYLYGVSRIRDSDGGDLSWAFSNLVQATVFRFVAHYQAGSYGPSYEGASVSWYADPNNATTYTETLLDDDWGIAEGVVLLVWSADDDVSVTGGVLMEQSPQSDQPAPFGAASMWLIRGSGDITVDVIASGGIKFLAGAILL